MAKKYKKVLSLKNGKKYEITRQDGRYYYCGDTQFLIVNPQILSVIKERVEIENGDGNDE